MYLVIQERFHQTYDVLQFFENIPYPWNYLTIILRARVGYEMIDSQRGA